GVHYYAMQFIEGQSLAALIRELREQERFKQSSNHTLRPVPEEACRSTPRVKRPDPISHSLRHRKPIERKHLPRRRLPFPRIAPRGAPCFSVQWPNLEGKRQRRWSMPTSWAWFIATSNRPTCWWMSAAIFGLPTSGWHCFRAAQG